MRHLVPALLSTVVVLLVAVAALAHAANPDCSSARCVYLPLVVADVRSTATPPSPTGTPTPLSPSFNGCRDDPNAGLAPNYPVKIVIVLKAANPEVVRLQNISAQTVDLTGWHMCSITGNQEQDGVGGTLAPGQIKDFPYTGAGFIWNNSVQDNGALYDEGGHLVSYWVDH